ncbi:hypothetical protein VTI74DRAFT_3790 [Chaetomium olivicolor]
MSDNGNKDCLASGQKTPRVTSRFCLGDPIVSSIPNMDLCGSNNAGQTSDVDTPMVDQFHVPDHLVNEVAALNIRDTDKNDKNQGDEIPMAVEQPAIPHSLVHKGPSINSHHTRTYLSPEAASYRPFTKLFEVARHLASSPGTAITKLVCVGLGPSSEARRFIETRDTLPSNTEANRSGASALSNALMRFDIGRVLKDAVAAQVATVEDASRKPMPIELYLIDDDEKYFRNGKLMQIGTVGSTLFRESIGGAWLVTEELHRKAFLFAPGLDAETRELVLGSDNEVAGMLWVDHVYDDGENKLSADALNILKMNYRRYPFFPIKGDEMTDGLKGKLAFYFPRSMLPDPMAGERRLLMMNQEHNRQVARLSNELMALHVQSMDTDSEAVSSASPKVICEEFLKVLGRMEAEHPIFCKRICLCQQFYRYQHYFLPLWKWGVKKIVCFGLGSFRNVKEDGGPFEGDKADVTYRDVIRDEALTKEFNARPVDRYDPLQTMLRHIAVIECATFLKLMASKRGVEHGLAKHYFKRMSIIQNAPGCPEEIGDKVIKKLEKMPPTAGYAGDPDLPDVPIYLHDREYTAEDREALNRLAEIFEMAHLPPVKVVDAAEQEGFQLIDEHTLVYSVDPDFPVRSIVMLSRARPTAMIWRDSTANPTRLTPLICSGDVLTDEAHALIKDGYHEYGLDKRCAPHTIGSSHMYIRKDVVSQTAERKIIPPYPIRFPHDYPHKHDNWYLDNLKKN